MVLVARATEKKQKKTQRWISSPPAWNNHRSETAGRQRVVTSSVRVFFPPVVNYLLRSRANSSYHAQGMTTCSVTDYHSNTLTLIWQWAEKSAVGGFNFDKKWKKKKKNSLYMITDISLFLLPLAGWTMNEAEIKVFGWQFYWHFIYSNTCLTIVGFF